MIPGLLLLGGVVWALPAVLADANAAYLYLFNGSSASYRLDGYPPIGAWRVLDRWLASSPTDVRAIDIYWLRFARTTRGASLLPFVACLGSAAAILWYLWVQGRADAVAARSGCVVRQCRARRLLRVMLTCCLLLGTFGGALSVYILTAPLPALQPWAPNDAAIETRGLFALEQDDQQVPFRWTNGDTTINVPINAGSGSLTLRLQRGSAQQQASFSIAEQATVALAPTTAERAYHLLVPQSFTQGRTLQLRLQSDTFQPPNENRRLGIVYRGLQWKPIAEVAQLGWLHELSRVLAGVCGILLLFLVLRTAMQAGMPRLWKTYLDRSGSQK